MKTNPVTISCICVTDSRPDLLIRAIYCFAQQDFQNKELVISYPRKDRETKQLINRILELNQIQILQIERENKESIGNARNIAISQCNGSYICIWDDDDWYHPNRLTFQYESLFKKPTVFNATILIRLLLYDSTTDKSYLSFPYTWENSLMCRKEIIMQNQYKYANRGEDTHIIKFLDNRKILDHIDAPYLYVYIYHGGNVWNYEHYKVLIDKSEELPIEFTSKIKENINAYTFYTEKI